MSKKILALLLACAAALGLAGCGGTGDPVYTGENIPNYGGERVDMSELDTYRNDMTLPEQWENYGVGDPYVMKYNGLFYLYASTPYGKRGIKVWSSPNALDWEYRGIVAEDRNSTYTAYSPKVVYDNGTFYLYTTPDGNGLHILTGPTPLGPFMDISGVQHPIERQNGQLVPCDCKVHASIDACIFIDDDGQWYLGHGHANDGIEYHKMISPTEIDPVPYYPGTVVAGNEGNKWTETGEIFKRDDTYFMTFSGNHVANDSYRTNWAASEKPLSGYKMGELPLLTSTQGELKGTGCGLVFTGADLVSDYVVYHNLINPKIGPIRGLNMDRIAYNGGEITAYGPTDFAQSKPAPPTSFSDMSDTSGFTGLTSVKDGFGALAAGQSAVYRAATSDEFVAEFNYNAGGEGAELYFSVEDDRNFDCLRVERDGALTLTCTRNGAATSYSAGLAAYRPEAVHTVRVDSRDGRLQVYVDGMRKFNLTGTGGGRLAYRFDADGQVGYTAFTDAAAAETAAKAYKPVTGKIFAKDYVPADSAAQIALTEAKSGSAVVLRKDGYARYRVNGGEKGGTFAASVTYRAKGSGVLAFLDESSSVLSTLAFSATDGNFVDAAASGVKLAAGCGVVTVAVLAGEADLYSFQLYPTEAVSAQSVSGIGEDGFTEMDGKWMSLSGTVKSYDIRGGEQANLVYGDSAWADITVSVDIKLDAATSGRAGLMLRVKNIAANTGNTHQIFAYNDQSYYVSLDGDGAVEIYKHNYDSNRVAVKRIDYEPGKTYTLKVVCRGNRLSVYVDGKLQLEYTDRSNPYLTGRVGLHSESCTAAYTNFKISA